jgi:hypothetical protein
MYEAIYKSEEVKPEFQPIFEQFCTEFGSKCQIWKRVEDFGRRLVAGVVNPSTQVAATITLQQGTRRRTISLSPSEIQRVREHFASDAQEDLRCN